MTRLLKSGTPAPRVAFMFLILSLVAVSSFAYPPARTLSRIVYDENVGRVVLFGGLTGADSSGQRTALNDMWHFTGRRWVEVFPAHSPQPRAAMVMVYDSHNDRTLIFGGYDRESFFNDVWQYKNGDWSEVQTSGTAPSPRRMAAGVYDPVLKRFIVYGGGNLTETFNDTWILDVTTDTWSRAVENTPALKVGATMAYSRARDEIILVGPNAAGATETYRWSGSSWTKLAPANQPTCVAQGAMTELQYNGNILQVAGLCYTNDVITGRSSDSFEWDGTTWTKNTSSTSPGSIFGHALTYDPRQTNAILFGGVDAAERSATFRYRGRWAGVRDPLRSPGLRSLSVGAIDPISGDFLVYAGRDDSAPFGDFWRHDGQRWSAIPSLPNGSCSNPVGTYDTDRKLLVVVCEGSELFEWNGSEWKAFKDFKKDDKPPIRRLSSIAYDPVAKKTWLFGGYVPDLYYREMWGWNGTRWDEVEFEGSKGPTSRMLAAMFFDPHTQRIMIFGGIGRKTRESSITRYDDMWSFNGTTFTAVTPATNPGARYGTSVAVAPARTVNGTQHPARVLMFGGKSGEEKYLNELWEWTGTNWVKVETTNAPPARMNATFVYDEKNDRFLLYGGWGGRTFGDLWQLKGNTWSVVPEPSGRSRTVSRGAVSTASPRVGKSTSID